MLPIALTPTKTSPILLLKLILRCLFAGSIEDFTKYEYLRISEVWLWQNDRIKFFQLVNMGYLESLASKQLPELSSDRVTEIVNTCFGKSVLEIEKYFN